jgi:hypothetical protein
MTKDLINPSAIPVPANVEFTIHILKQILSFIEQWKMGSATTHNMYLSLKTSIENLITSLQKPTKGVPRPSDEEIDKLNGIMKPLGIERRF